MAVGVAYAASPVLYSTQLMQRLPQVLLVVSAPFLARESTKLPGGTFKVPGTPSNQDSSVESSYIFEVNRLFSGLKVLAL